MVAAMSTTPFSSFTGSSPVGPEHVSVGLPTLVAGPVQPRDHSATHCPDCDHPWGYHLTVDDLAVLDATRLLDAGLLFDGQRCCAYLELEGCPCTTARPADVERSRQVTSWYGYRTHPEHTHPEPAPPPLLSELMVTNHGHDGTHVTEPFTDGLDHSGRHHRSQSTHEKFLELADTLAHAQALLTHLATELYRRD